MSKLA